MVFCNDSYEEFIKYVVFVTILILIDGFLQSTIKMGRKTHKKSHNPYFNRWFSAIHLEPMNKEEEDSHNPYFNRWFSAIMFENYRLIKISKSQSLF